MSTASSSKWPDHPNADGAQGTSLSSAEKISYLRVLVRLRLITKPSSSWCSLWGSVVSDSSPITTAAIPVNSSFETLISFSSSRILTMTLPVATSAKCRFRLRDGWVENQSRVVRTEIEAGWTVFAKIVPVATRYGPCIVSNSIHMVPSNKYILPVISTPVIV